MRRILKESSVLLIGFAIVGIIIYSIITVGFPSRLSIADTREVRPNAKTDTSRFKRDFRSIKNEVVQLRDTNNVFGDEITQVYPDNNLIFYTKQLVEQQVFISQLESNLTGNPQKLASALRGLLLTNGLKRILLRSNSLDETYIMNQFMSQMPISH